MKKEPYLRNENPDEMREVLYLEVKNSAVEGRYKTRKISFFKNPKVLPNSIIVTDFRPEGEDAKVRIQRFIDDLSATMTFITTTLTSVLLATKL